MLPKFEPFTKEEMNKYFKYQFITFLILGILGIILTYKICSPIITIIVLNILALYSYFIHIFLHIHSDNFLNIHSIFHHNNTNTNFFINAINWIMEIINNILMFLPLYLFKIIFKLNFIPDILILYYIIIYVSVHNINYTIFHASENHSFHHKIKNPCNYGPDVFDHLFKTNYNNNFENNSHMLPNIFFSFLITYYLFKPNNIIDYKYIKIIFIFYAIIFTLYKILK